MADGESSVGREQQLRGKSSELRVQKVQSRGTVTVTETATVKNQ
jgi:hypothetical protein